MALMSLRLYGIALILVGLASREVVDAWSHSPSSVRTVRPSSTQLYKYTRDRPYKNQYIREYNRRRREEEERRTQYGDYGNDYYDYDTYDHGYRRGSYYNNNDQGYNQGYNQGYGYNNVQYSGTAAPLVRSPQGWNDNYNDSYNYNQNGLNNGYSYNEPYRRPMSRDTAMSKVVANSVSNAVEFSKNIDTAIERMMTPIIRKSSRGLVGTLRKGMNDKMMKLAPEEADLESILDEALEILRYDAYVVQDLLQAKKRIEIAPDGRSIFSHYSTVSSQIINERQETFASTKLGVYLNYHPWKLWIDCANGVLQKMVLVNDNDNFEYDVLQNYDRNNFRPKYYLDGREGYIDV